MIKDMSKVLSEGQVGDEAMGNCTDVSDAQELQIEKYFYIMVLQRVNIINLCSHPTIKHLTVIFSSQILFTIYQLSNSSLIISFIILCVFVLSQPQIISNCMLHDQHV